MIFKLFGELVFGLNKGFCRTRYRSGNVNIGHTLTLQFEILYICKNRVIFRIILTNVK